ncbi:MAG: GNAT family N-acetyltransferase [Rhodoferax sp.]
MALHTSPLVHAALPKGLYRVPLGAIDWTELRQCHAQAFAGVPNSPIPDEATLQDKWAPADPRASLIVADAAGTYQAFALVTGSVIELVGVRTGWRGQGLAAALYHRVATELVAQGTWELRARVASVNAASMRLHAKLGFDETAPRWMVHELAW